MLVSRARYRCLVALIGALYLGAPVGLAAQPAPAAVPGPVTLQGAAFGQNVALSWTPSAGATSYEIAVGVQSNAYLLVQDVGSTTAISVSAPAGVYFARVAGRNAEGLGQPSNEVMVVVSPSASARPVAPTGLQAQAAGETVTLTWQLGQGGGPASGLIFAVGSAPGAHDLGLVPLNVTTQASSTVPPGTYFARLFAVGPGGISDASNEVTVLVGSSGCEALVGPLLSAAVSGSNVLVSWTPVPGVAGYRLDVSMTPGGPLVLSQGVGAATTSLSASGVFPGTYYAKVASITPCGSEATGPEVAITVTQQSGGRTPDPPPGQRLPLPNRLSVI